MALAFRIGSFTDFAGFGGWCLRMFAVPLLRRPLQVPGFGFNGELVLTGIDKMSSQAAIHSQQTHEAEPELRYHIFQLDIPPDGCYLFTFSCPERSSTYFNALMVQHGQIVGLTEHTPVLLGTSENPIGGLAITHPVLEDGSVGGPGFAMRLRNLESTTMSWDRLMSVKEADTAFKELRKKVATVVEEFLDRPGHCGPMEAFAECEEAFKSITRN
jgi:hypothetical protein